MNDTGFHVSSVAEGAAVMDYFNGFHDGFMKRIQIVSADRIAVDHSQTCTGLFEVEMDFSHYNYARGTEPFHPFNQIIQARFGNVQDVFYDLREKFVGNTILALSVESARRRQGGATATEGCLSLRLTRHFFREESRQFEPIEHQLFTFSEATFVERPVADAEGG